MIRDTPKSTSDDQLSSVMCSIVSGVSSGVEQRIACLERENSELSHRRSIVLKIRSTPLRKLWPNKSHRTTSLTNIPGPIVYASQVSRRLQENQLITLS